MAIGEFHALAREFVKMGCFYDRVAIAGQIAITQIVGQEDDEVGSAGLGVSRIQCRTAGQDCRRSTCQHRFHKAASIKNFHFSPGK